MKEFIHSIATSLSAGWRSLVATDLLFKLLAFSVLIPLFGLLWQCLQQSIIDDRVNILRIIALI